LGPVAPGRFAGDEAEAHRIDVAEKTIGMVVVTDLATLAEILPPAANRTVTGRDTSSAARAGN
jgi:hypothetical protein